MTTTQLTAKLAELEEKFDQATKQIIQLTNSVAQLTQVATTLLNHSHDDQGYAVTRLGNLR